MLYGLEELPRLSQMEQLSRARFMESSTDAALGLETDSLSHMTIVSKVQKSLADLEVLHSTDSGANLFIPAAMGQNSQNKIEDSLSSSFADSFVPMLVGLLNHGCNPDIMFLAARALTYLVDVLPSSCSVAVHYGEVSCFIAHLLTIECIDLAKQVTVPSLASVYNEYALKSQFETNIYRQWEALALLLIGISVNQQSSLPEVTTALGRTVTIGAYFVHESDDVEDSEGKRKEKIKEESESYSGKDEDRRDSRDEKEEDPLVLPMFARDISIESYGLTT
ncbi:hypothetical protein FXO38_28403 [Capsicum annuum]|nr:hypothetical protein FXO38_28403 [Capsicum annuum]KAF3674655.1 hypothetical protein FXO37_06282 [Capsicum annuum]